MRHWPVAVPAVALMVTGIVLAPISPMLSAITHTATVGVPSAVLKTDALKCRFNGTPASGGKVVPL